MTTMSSSSNTIPIRCTMPSRAGSSRRRRTASMSPNQIGPASAAARNLQWNGQAQVRIGDVAELVGVVDIGAAGADDNVLGLQPGAGGRCARHNFVDDHAIGPTDVEADQENKKGKDEVEERAGE